MCAQADQEHSNLLVGQAAAIQLRAASLALETAAKLEWS